jgi:ankyrin repeat protein
VAEVTKLLQAVLDEDEAAVATLLREGADPNEGDKFGDLPLVNAVSQDTTLGIVKLLIDANAKLEVTNDETGSTPLVLAIAGGASGIARYLIERGADVNVAGDVSDVFGRQSPLILAAEANDVELVRILLARGADPNRFGDFHGRALHSAADDERTELLTVLVEGGANIWFRDGDNDDTALGVAILRKQWRAARLLYRYADAQQPNHLGTPLHALAASFDVARVEALLDAGVGIDLRDGAGKTPLHWAVGGPRPLSKLILEAMNHPPASRCTKGAPATMVARLLARGAPIDAVDSSGSSPLHDALAWGGAQQLDLAAHLVAAGANVRLITSGFTPLLLAARSSAPPALIAQLIAAGADTQAKQGPWNALTYAAHVGSPKTVQALLEHGVPLSADDVRSPLHAAAAMGHVEVVRVLVEASADPTARDAEGKTAADVTKSTEILAILSRARR